MSNEKSCGTCRLKSGCLKRSTSLFLMFIQTGRSDEFTDEIRENFDCGAECEHWTAKLNDEKEDSDDG